MKRSLTLAAALGFGLAGAVLAEEPANITIESKPIAQSARPSNQQLARTVAAQLQKIGLRGYTIDITVNDGVVELSGRVADKVQHDEAIRTVLSVPGVKSVVDGLMAANFAPIHPVQSVSPSPVVIENDQPPVADPGVLPPPMTSAPIVDPIPITQPFGAAPYDLNPPKLPPYSWPTYAPYNNYSRVAYPTQYPYNAWPFIGPFYPFPKVPLGWRSVTLEWQDGHWFMGRNGTKHDYWRIRYW